MNRGEAIQKKLSSFLEKGNTFVDIGAFIGIESIIAANKVGKDGIVYSFEPITDNYEALYKNISQFPNILSFKRAFLLEDDEVKMYISDTDPKDNRLYDFEGASNYETVKTIGLNDVYFEHVNLIKISAQGMEDFIVEGGTKIIEIFRPYLMIDFNTKLIEESGSDPSDVLSYYDKMDYAWEFLYKNDEDAVLWMEPE